MSNKITISSKKILLFIIDLFITFLGYLGRLHYVIKKFSRSHVAVPSIPSVPSAATLFVIKMDALGDYIIFRNFLEEIKNTREWNEYNIVLIGNTLWKDLTLSFDQNFLEDTFFLSPQDFYFKLIYRIKLSWKLLKFSNIYANNKTNSKINNKNFILCPTYSRKFFIDDSLTRIIWAAHGNNSKVQRVVHKGDTSNIKKWQQYWSSLSLYSKSIASFPIEETIFEFYRYRRFFSKILERDITLNRPFLLERMKPAPIAEPVTAPVIFLVPGAGVPERRWPTKSFAELVLLFHEKGLQKNTKYEFVIIGTDNEKNLGKEIITHLEIYSQQPHELQNEFQDEPQNKDINESQKKDKISIENLCGKLSLDQLAYQMINACLVITNETGTAHLAQALGIPIICLATYHHYLRFHPYPNALSRHYRHSRHSHYSRYWYPEIGQGIEHIPAALIFQNAPI
ncbi:MAG: glycosyltransferase family 9 protein [Oligoflexia bacterium]|nr:glycosyltransferase family 9 protein [Oligoflexia bacterium]